MEWNKNSNCSYCGTLFLEQINWPRQCATCNNESYTNPIPVSVSLIPVWVAKKQGLLIQRRNINPKKGEWALTGGYLNANEDWKIGAAREIKEELNLAVESKDIILFDVINDKKNHLLIFNYVSDKTRISSDKIDFTPNDEVSEITIVYQPMELAFPTHTEMLARYFNEIY